MKTTNIFFLFWRLGWGRVWGGAGGRRIGEKIPDKSEHNKIKEIT